VVPESRLGFTLSEVLITLGIIGVVAVMTMPIIIQKYRIKQYEIGFKTAYSLLHEAVKNINANDFMFSQNLTYGYGTAPSEEYDCVKIFAKVFKGAINLKLRGPYQGYKTYSNQNFSGGSMDDGFFELPNGMSVFFEIQDYTNHPILIFDTNGYRKKPNRYGFDTFAFIIGKDDKVYPMGDPNIQLNGVMRGSYQYSINYYCSENNSHRMNGYACAYKVFHDPDYWKNLPH